MKKLIVTEAQYKMLQLEGMQYTPEKIDQFVEEAKSDVAKSKQAIEGYFARIAATNIGEIVDDIAGYEELHKKLEETQKHYEAKFNKYYDIVEMYDWMDQPDNVHTLDRTNNAIDNNQMDLYRLCNALETLIEAAKDMKKLLPEHQDMNEQIFQGIKDKIGQVKDKLTGKKEVPQAGKKPQGRNMDELKAEWSKINANTGDLRAYGEGVSPNENTARTAAQMNANRVILKKLGKQEATFGSIIEDDAMFQLENGNYFCMVIIKPNNIK